MRLAGGLEREVKVDVDLGKLKFYGISFTDVIEAIAFENVTVPGGTIDVGDVKYLVRVPGEFEDTESLIGDIVIEAPVASRSTCATWPRWTSASRSGRATRGSTAIRWSR